MHCLLPAMNTHNLPFSSTLEYKKGLLPSNSRLFLVPAMGQVLSQSYLLPTPSFTGFFHIVRQLPQPSFLGPHHFSLVAYFSCLLASSPVSSLTSSFRLDQFSLILSLAPVLLLHSTCPEFTSELLGSFDKYLSSPFQTS